MNEQPLKKQKSTADAKVSPEIGGSCNDPTVTSLSPALPDVLDEAQTKLDAILNPKPIEQGFLPADYCCPITSRLMREPVIASDGHFYEREAIEAWLESHNTSPLADAEPLTSKILTPVLFVRNAVDKLLAQHPELRDSKEWYLPESWIRELGQACEADNEAAIRELVSRDRRLLVHTFGNKSVHGGKTATRLAVALASKPRTLEVVMELLEKREQGLALAALLQNKSPGFSLLHKAIIAKRHFSIPLQIMAWMGKRLSQVTHWPRAFVGVDLPKPILDALREPLLWSVDHRDLVKIACLLSLRADPNPYDNQGIRVLYSLVAQKAQVAGQREDQGLGEVMKLLLQARADPNALNKDEDDAPLHLAIRKGLIATALELTQANARLDLRLKDGTTPLHMVASKQSTEMADALWGAEAKRLPGSELEATSGPEGDTALHCAAKSGSCAMLRWLVGRGAQITTVNAKRQSILHVAAIHNHTQFAKVVVELTNKSTARALSFPDCDGNTPLHLAAQAAASDMAGWLLTELELSPSKNLAGQLPRQVAESLGHLATVRVHDEIVATMKAKEEALLTQQGPLGELLLRQQRLIEKQQEHLEQLSEAAGAYEARFLRQEQELAKLKAERHQELQYRVPYFLKHVVRGEEKEAETMIVNNPKLLLCPGEVTDLSGRTFENITGFQYALWALDVRMWEMMLEHLPNEQALLQYRALETHGTEHGKQADWSHLINAIDDLTSWLDQAHPRRERCGAFLKVILKEQRLLPAHVVNECCRDFDESSDFEAEPPARVSVVFWYGYVNLVPTIWLTHSIRASEVTKAQADRYLERMSAGLQSLLRRRGAQYEGLRRALAEEMS